MPNRSREPAKMLRDALFSRYARTAWVTLLLIAAYAVVLRAGLLG